jgi:hypothetical protein
MWSNFRPPWPIWNRVKIIRMFPPFSFYVSLFLSPSLSHARAHTHTRTHTVSRVCKCFTSKNHAPNFQFFLYASLPLSFFLSLPLSLSLSHTHTQRERERERHTRIFKVNTCILHTLNKNWTFLVRHDDDVWKRNIDQRKRNSTRILRFQSWRASGETRCIWPLLKTIFCQEVTKKALQHYVA